MNSDLSKELAAHITTYLYDKYDADIANRNEILNAFIMAEFSILREFSEIRKQDYEKFVCEKVAHWMKYGIGAKVRQS